MIDVQKSNHASPQYLSFDAVADLLSISKRTLEMWIKNKKIQPAETQNNACNTIYFEESQLMKFDQYKKMKLTTWHTEKAIVPLKHYGLVELFAGAGGLALGLEQAGFKSLFLNEVDKYACETLKKNRPEWNVVHGDIQNIAFENIQQNVDLLTGGFPCQAFSYAGHKLGFDDTRGTLFFEFARAVKTLQPKVFMAENVRGLLNHDDGRTIATIKQVIADLGYTLVEPRVLKAIFYKVPQKRERLFLIGIRNDYANKVNFHWPAPFERMMNLRDALKAGELYPCDVPPSSGQTYPARKKAILDHVPPGGYWRDLPLDLQKEYMQASFYLGGGKTGMARRLSLEAPSLTLTCAPAQKQTERCHPEETRPLQTREYARIQTFPDEWEFCGSTSAVYKQIGNAVPVNLASAVGRSLIRLLNDIEQLPCQA
ncbi:MAG: DNA (cytosine-5-)-methyltransferase [Shewanellaceae bacterium]|nr:DNA (cytosine-5-)-methyltransferase [Shewanellaceae bacterium]